MTNYEYTLTVQQYAEKYSVTQATVRTWIRDGRLPGRKFGSTWRVADMPPFSEPQPELLDTQATPEVKPEPEPEDESVKASKKAEAVALAETAKIVAELELAVAMGERDHPTRLVEREADVTLREQAVTEREQAHETMSSTLDEVNRELSEAQAAFREEVDATRRELDEKAEVNKKERAANTRLSHALSQKLTAHDEREANFDTREQVDSDREAEIERSTKSNTAIYGHAAAILASNEELVRLGKQAIKTTGVMRWVLVWIVGFRFEERDRQGNIIHRQG